MLMSAQFIWPDLGHSSARRGEPKAIEKYESQTGTVVSTSGLLVDPKYPFLGCSPDSLVGQDGIFEI